jgi:probable phosphoglycerate mutase
MIIYIVRHCETLENELGIVMGQLNGKLSNNGLVQCQMLSERLKDECFDYIYSSDLKRAVDTTLEIANYHLETPIQYDKRLREINLKKSQGKLKSELSNNFRDEFNRESNSSLYNRAHRFLKTILKRNGDEKILIIGHAVINSVLISIIKHEKIDDIFSELEFNNASISIYEVSASGWSKVICENDVSHL